MATRDTPNFKGKKMQHVPRISIIFVKTFSGSMNLNFQKKTEILFSERETLQTWEYHHAPPKK